MPYCQNCGQRHDVGINYCPDCGFSLANTDALQSDENTSTTRPSSKVMATSNGGETEGTGDAVIKMFLAGVVGVLGAYYFIGGPFVEPTAGENYNLNFFIVAFLLFAVITYLID